MSKVQPSSSNPQIESQSQTTILPWIRSSKIEDTSNVTNVAPPPPQPPPQPISNDSQQESQSQANILPPWMRSGPTSNYVYEDRPEHFVVNPGNTDYYAQPQRVQMNCCGCIDARIGIRILFILAIVNATRYIFGLSPIPIGVLAPVGALIFHLIGFWSFESKNWSVFRFYLGVYALVILTLFAYVIYFETTLSNLLSSLGNRISASDYAIANSAITTSSLLFAADILIESYFWYVMYSYMKNREGN